MARLFNDEFLRSIERLRIVTRQAPVGGTHAEHRTHDLGSGMEFRDFRPYVPGDDLRRIDWNLYRRSGRLFMRLFEEVEDLPVSILLDASDSMYFETPPRADAARQMAAIIASVALNQHDRVTLVPFGTDRLKAPPPMVGKAALRRALDYLEHLGPAGPTNMARSIQRFASLPQRPGLAVVISDFFDPHGIDRVIAALRSLRHRLVLVQVVRAEDREPPLDGELRLIDCETGSGIDVSVTAETRQRYRDAYEAFERELAMFASRRRAIHLRLDAEQPVLEQLSHVFVDGVLTT